MTTATASEVYNFRTSAVGGEGQRQDEREGVAIGTCYISICIDYIFPVTLALQHILISATASTSDP